MGKNADQSRIIGDFTLPDGQCRVGHLHINGEETLLKIHSDQKIYLQENSCTVTGTSYSGDHITLINCFSPSSGTRSFKNEKSRHHIDIFPHYIAIGRGHLSPNENTVKKIHFSTIDISTLFYDFDAFNHVIDSQSVIDVILQQNRKIRPIETGEYPEVMYFTGKFNIISIDTPSGRVTVDHRPRSGMGGPDGVYIKNRITITYEPKQPIDFQSALNRASVISHFLSSVAGRTQGIKDIEITTTELINGQSLVLSVEPSYKEKDGSEIEQHRPHPGDIPLDPIQHKAEFEEVFINWITKHETWRPARQRYIDCMRKENRYSADRLVAAANMFDILPSDATPNTNAISPEMEAARKACIDILRNTPQSIDRNAALSALGRLGQPSLPKKVKHRIAVIANKLPGRFTELELVAGVAVKCRNYFVHGSLDGIEYSDIEKFLPFLTNSLEFIFLASDFIDSGWDAPRWFSEPHGGGHSFCRFTAEYQFCAPELQRVLNKPNG